MHTSTKEEIEREYSKILKKEDFEKMEVIGQFNMGFIIVKLGTNCLSFFSHISHPLLISSTLSTLFFDLMRCKFPLFWFHLSFSIESKGPDLFIVDQHAADEKYNFEILQEKTKINTQKMLKYAITYKNE
jgi:DNA mismatch repair protein PMS2